MFLTFIQVYTHGLLEELVWVGRYSKEGESQEFPNYEPCKELVEHVFFECASYVFQRLIIWTIFKNSFLQIV